MKPYLRLAPNTFTVVLPNRNAPVGAGGQAEDGGSVVENRLLSMLREGTRTRGEVHEVLGVSQTTAIRLLGELVKRGLIQKRGAGKNTVYELSS